MKNLSQMLFFVLDYWEIGGKFGGYILNNTDVRSVY